MRDYRASALGYSLCQLVNPHLGFQSLPVPDYLQSAFDEGHRLEPIVIAKLRDTLDCQIAYQNIGSEDGLDGEEVVLEVIPGMARIVGHVDGRIKVTSNGPEKVLEIKSMSDKNFRQFSNTGFDNNNKLFEKYKWQVSAYMLATQMPLMLVAWNKVTEEIARQTFTEPFYTMSDIANRIYAAERQIKLGVPPDTCEDFPCSYVYLHGEKVVAEVADEELDYLMAMWLDADRKVKAEIVEKDRLRSAIVEYVGEEGAGKVKGSQGVTVNVAWQPESSVAHTKKAGWVTTVSAPRARKVEDGS